MIQEHKDERFYANWKLTSRFYEMSFTSESGKLQNVWLSLKRGERGNPSYAIPNSLGSITLDELEDLSDIIEKAQGIIMQEGLYVKGEGSDEQADLTEAINEAKQPTVFTGTKI